MNGGLMPGATEPSFFETKPLSAYCAEKITFSILPASR
jgi:hypothetical protein